MYPKVWKALARVANSERGYAEYAETLEQLEHDQPVALRHAMAPQLAPVEDRIPGDRVDSSVGEHTLPFVISSMSFGSQNEVAFRAYAEAAARADMLCMNGEGGEIPDMYGKYPKHRGQQIASGRFGVSSLLINSSETVEIKIGQGAKPGEGGHLPGSKVTAAIARARNAQIGSDLISPSNNHDLYSIEDLAQLIDELKTANPHVRVIVKVPVVPGIGTIAIGIAKAGADVITLSGFDGGTGAARQHALRRAGLPCEIGTALAHHALTEAGIRDRVEIWADGGCGPPPTPSSSSASARTGWASAPPRWWPSAAPSAAAVSWTPATWASRPRWRTSTRPRSAASSGSSRASSSPRRRPWCGTSPRWATP